jgi:hypothetical protein
MEAVQTVFVNYKEILPRLLQPRCEVLSRTLLGVSAQPSGKTLARHKS